MPAASFNMADPPTLASLINISNNYTINHYKCRLAIIRQSTKEIFDFMHLYHQYYNKLCML